MTNRLLAYSNDPEHKCRLCLADVLGGEMNAWQTNPKGRLRGGYFDLRIADLENVVCVLLEKPQESWHCSFVKHFVRVSSLVMSAIVLRICWAYESRENTNFSFNSCLQRFVFIILKPDRATFAISLVFDRPMSQTMTYFSGDLVLLLMGACEAKDNISRGMCIYQSPYGVSKNFLYNASTS